MIPATIVMSGAAVLSVSARPAPVSYTHLDVYKRQVDTIPDFPPRPAWEDLCVLAREDDIAAEVCNQELTVSWA